MEKAFETDLNMDWQYESKMLYGRCRINEDELTLTFTFKQRMSDSFFDVVQMEYLIGEHLRNTLTTVEEMAVIAKSLWPTLEVEVKGMADSHGLITVRL